MRLDYKLSAPEPDIAEDIDLRTASETRLRYQCFLGDIVIVADDVDLSTDYGWVPVLDFAAALRSIASALEHQSQATFEFTESTERIEFERDGDRVRLRASYAPQPAEVAYEDLTAAADEFLARMLDDLTAAHPELAENAYVAGLAPAG